jgi:hypothetical protein
MNRRKIFTDFEKHRLLIKPQQQWDMLKVEQPSPIKKARLALNI